MDPLLKKQELERQEFFRTYDLMTGVSASGRLTRLNPLTRLTTNREQGTMARYLA